MQIDTLLTQLTQTLAQLKYGENPAELYAPIQYMMDLGGKRLRPLLTLLGGKLYTDAIESFTLPALGIEVFHNFTLMHDDIMDKAPLRRGKATVHTKWSESTAILSGDVMLIKAYQLFMNVPERHLNKVLTLFNQCAIEVCEGQQWDMNFETLPTVTEAQYIEMIRLKTAVLLGFALSLGAVLADAPASDIDALKELGENMGIGFQLKDDLLDVFGSAEKVGKQVGGDIISNKKTFLLIEALERATGKQREDLMYWLDTKGTLPAQKVEAVMQIYRELEIDTLTEAKIQMYFDKAYTQLEALHTPDPKKLLLRSFMDWLIARES